MVNSQIKKILIVFGAIFAICLTYSLISTRMYEPFTNDIPMKTCKANSDCPDKFKCKDAKCVYDRPLP